MSIDRQSLPAISAHTKRTWQRMRHDHSAGGVAYRYIGDEGELEVALIATKGMSRWQLPKGSCEIGESTEETAIREVEEEAGLSTRREAFLKTIEYWYWDTYRKEVPELVHKEVDFYLLRVVGGQINDECCEVDAVGWFAPQQALGMLTYDGERARSSWRSPSWILSAEPRPVDRHNPLIPQNRGRSPAPHPTHL